MYDLVIIGGGPAGFSAALTARKRNLNICMIYPEENGSWLTKIKMIDNYPGLINTSGEDMLSLFEKQAIEMGAVIHNGVVKQIIQNDGTFLINVGKDYLESKKIILATGIKKPSLIKNESLFIGRGISYCATCDGMLYRDKVIALIDENNDKTEINFLISLARKVYLISNFSNITSNDKVEVLKGKIKSVDGDDVIKSINVDGKDYAIDGLFIFRNIVPLNTLLPNLQTENNFIKVDKRMSTNIHNVYAAGDCTGEPLQIAKAVGEGNIASISASLEWYNEREGT